MLNTPAAGTNPSSAKIATDLPLKAGQVLEGKFRVEKIIGEGAMGLVVEATHLALDERVALKFLRRDARERPEIVARFAREARAAAKIKSDHVARVYDVGTAPDGSPFIVMEYLEGRDLERVLEDSGKLTPLDAVEHVIEACEGLATAHALGIIHRDIKPGNLFLTEQGGRRQIKVLDFGISKAGISGTFEDIDIAMAQTTQIMGSPHYMSPEQIRSTKDVDQRADVWSLGVVLFELLTRETPFTATDVTGIIAQVLYEPHRSARSLVPELSEALEKIVDRCLEKDAEKRFASAAELAAALLPFAPKRARAVVERANALSTRSTGKFTPADSYPPPPVRGSTTGSGITAPVASEAVALSSRPKRGVVGWLAMACVVIGAIAASFVVVSRMRAPSDSETATAAPPENRPIATAAPRTPPAITAEPTKEDPAAAPAVSAEPTPKAAVATAARPTPANTAAATSKTPRTTGPRATTSSRPHGEPGENEIRLER